MNISIHNARHSLKHPIDHADMEVDMPVQAGAVGKDAALQILAKGLPNIGLWGVVVALAVELTGAGEFMPGLEMFGDGLVQQSPLGVARVVKFGLCIRWPTRVRMRLRWACSGGHGAVPAWAGCPMILGLYPASASHCRSAF